jgi:ferredoxin
MFKVHLHTQSVTLSFQAHERTSLMECAQEFEINIPSSCRNGTCRTCLTLALSGKVRYDIGWPGLSHEEKIEGWILPCVAIACSDLVIVNSKAYLI